MNEVTIRGTTYRSYTDAAKAHGVTASAVHKAKLRGTLDGVGLGRRVSDAERLLEWMTFHHLPLQLWREEEGGPWVVVDASSDRVLGSGGSAHDALIAARRNSTDH